MLSMAKDNSKKNKQTKKKAPRKVSSSSKVNDNKANSVQAAEPKWTPVVETDTIQETAAPAANKFKRWNSWLAVVYALQGLAIVLFGTQVMMPIMVQYPSVDTLASQAAGQQVIGSAAHHLTDINLAWIVAIFLIVFAAVRFVMGGLLRTSGGPSTARGISCLHWGGFGMGGAVMMLAIALLSGIYQISSLLLLMGSVFAGSMLMLTAETLVINNSGVRTRLSKSMYWLAVGGIFAPWVIFATTLTGALTWNGYTAAYMYSIYACTFLLFVALALAVGFRMKGQGKWADAMYAERGYTLLEFLAATLLAWQIFAGVLR